MIGFVVQSTTACGRRKHVGTSLLVTRRRGLSSISTPAALRLLGLTHEQHATLTLPQLRQAYFAAAKRCHPDMQQTDEGNTNTSHDDFLRLTDAYERLSQSVTGIHDVATITADEEAAFRTACDLQLGVPAEMVEECKRSPVFRQWLAGRTDSAHTWRNFLTQNGGLAPKLAPVAGHLGMSEDVVPRLRTRRKRR